MGAAGTQAHSSHQHRPGAVLVCAGVHTPSQQLQAGAGQPRGCLTWATATSFGGEVSSATGVRAVSYAMLFLSKPRI